MDLCETRVAGFVVVSNSCDVVRDPQERPFVQVAPLVEVPESVLREVKLEAIPRYALAPALEDRRLVTDLDRVMTVEKPVVENWTHRRGCLTDHDSRRFSAAIERKNTRAAFPEEFSQRVRPLVRRIRDKHKKATEEGDALRALREIRVEASPAWDAEQVSLFFWFVRYPEDQTYEGTAWDEYLERWRGLVEVGGKYAEVDGAVVTLEDMTGHDYVHSDQLDLEHLSGRVETGKD